MSSRALPSSKKTHSEKHKLILKQLLRETANKSCADCKVTKNPRWASWNLGCFVCIRCSGIHRSMGTHISKVKSVDLDAWTDDQIENMIKWGNEKSNYFWEQKLPDGYTPDQSKIESFIRTKYDIKKWAASSIVPDPLTINIPNQSNALSSNSTSSSLSSATSTTTSSSSIKAPQPKSTNLLDEDFGDFTSSPSSTPTPTPIPSSVSATATAYSRSLPKAASASANLTPPLPTPPQQRSQSAQSTGGSITSNGRPDLKKSILSLYSSPSASTSFLQPQQSVRNQSFSPSPVAPNVFNGNNNNSLNVNSLSNSLSGLQFGGTSASSTVRQSTSNVSSNSSSINITTSTTTTSTTKPISNETGWKNEWNDSSSSSLKNQWNQPVKSSTTSNNNIGLDDDLFKNVWN